MHWASLCPSYLRDVLSQPSLHQTPIRTSFAVDFPWVARFAHNAVTGEGSVRVLFQELPNQAAEETEATESKADDDS